jgi:molybdopterin converting factor subunit 1
VVVKLLFFAVLRDIVGRGETSIDVPVGTRASDVWRDLRAQHDELTDYVRPPLTAVNESYVEPDTVLSQGDELAFIPPVAGG